MTELHPRMRNPERALARYGDLAVRWSAALERDDPLADAVAEAMSEHRQVGADLRAALDRGRAPPHAAAEVQALIADVADLPAGTHVNQLARAGRYFFRTGPIGGAALGAGSLVGGYASPEGNKPLVFSGRLLNDVTRRLAETATYVVETHRPGGVLPGGKGWALGVHVRVMHAVVRRRIRMSPGWQQAWGAPINQHDMAATQLLFGIVWLEGIRALGWPVRADEAEDHLALWRVAGRWMGVDPALMPDDEPSALRALALVHDTEGEPDDDARRLVRAMLDTVPEGPLRDLRLQFAESLLVRVQGPARARQLGLREGPMRQALPLLTVPGRPLALAARLSPRAEAVLVDAGERYWRAAGMAPLPAWRPATAGG